ncbi:MAG TPA: bifunctional DNA-formamidopyrimidine glycosylase/DNA-(apurinic or apyrimidinic site) lyase [Gammaproteobacteria bacterium]|jgi:formamidopyrimidine-DNA glycosylase|nr:bifunctional DNA-formamidopyrimidine glycosylase/DNA-(apurinic or apyrimidinic site) lyase [Gammaproteobacteria bacterium]
MPELPEVETARRGIEPYLKGRRVNAVTVRERRLRWPIPPALLRELPGQRITEVTRRGKYLLLHTKSGTAILHLGMSGSLRVLPKDTPPQKHDHVDLVMDSGKLLRLRDPRRFGALLWTRGDAADHTLLKDLGPEPLEAGFDGDYLFEQAKGRKVAIKNFLMDSHRVVGVGNIYASESLYLARIHPERLAGRVSRERYVALAKAVKQVLTAAIKAGGTTLRDFTKEDGEPGYFYLRLRVYDREGQPCKRCGTAIVAKVTGQRMTYYCPHCQR